MADIFLSYKREERDRCVAINDALVSLGLSVWFDIKLEPGRRYNEKIERELAEASVVLVLWSNLAVKSDWVRDEAEAGLSRDRLVAASLEPCKPPIGLRTVQAVTIGAPTGEDEGWLKVVDRIGVLLQRPGLSDFVRCRALGQVDAWKRWLVDNRTDPLFADAVLLLADAASPDLQRELAAEKAQREILQGEIEEYRNSKDGEVGQLRASGAELAKLRRAHEQLEIERAELQEKVHALSSDAPAAVGVAIEAVLTAEAESRAGGMIEEQRAANSQAAGPAAAAPFATRLFSGLKREFGLLSVTARAALGSLAAIVFVLGAAVWARGLMPDPAPAPAVPAPVVRAEPKPNGASKIAYRLDAPAAALPVEAAPVPAIVQRPKAVVHRARKASGASARSADAMLDDLDAPVTVVSGSSGGGFSSGGRSHWGGRSGRGGMGRGGGMGGHGGGFHGPGRSGGPHSPGIR
jgi:hypothetical protein